MRYLWMCLLVGMGTASADPVTVCATSQGTVTVISLSPRPGRPGETFEQTAARRLADTLAGRADIDPADCVAMDDTTLPTTRREACKLQGKRVVIDPTVPDPQNAKDATEARVKAALGLTDSELADLKDALR